MYPQFTHVARTVCAFRMRFQRMVLQLLLALLALFVLLVFISTQPTLIHSLQRCSTTLANVVHFVFIGWWKHLANIEIKIKIGNSDTGVAVAAHPSSTQTDGGSKPALLRTPNAAVSANLPRHSDLDSASQPVFRPQSPAPIVAPESVETDRTVEISPNTSSLAWRVQDKRIWKLIQSVDITSKPYYLASCVRITNEESFMYEWLVHCLLNGFNHVYVYDNSMMGFDAREALQPFIDIGYVTYINRSADVMQSHPFYLNKSQSYSPPQPIHLQWLSDECVQTYRQEMVWFVTTDVDEFWIAPIGINLAQYLRMIEPNTDALSVSWRLMRPLGLWSVSDTRVRSQVYTEQCSKASTRGAVNCNHRKMIAKAAMVHHFDAPDEPVLVVGARHRFLGCGGQVEYIHYYYKTFEEMLSKRHRGWSLLLKKGRRPEHAEVIDPGIVYCSYNLSEPNPKLAAFVKAIPYYMDDLPQIDYRRLTPTCPPVKPYPPGREPPIERKYLYFERKFDQCLRFSERKYESLARQVAQRQTNLTWPLLFDFMLNADFSGSLERYDSLFEPWAECPSPYPCPIPAPPGGFGNETDIDDEPNAARPAGWAWV